VTNEAPVETQKISPFLHRIQAAQYDLLRDRARGLDQLNKLFREGTFPRAPLDGATNGQPIAVDIAPLVSGPVAELLLRTKPWHGKLFDSENSTGENLLTPQFVTLSRMLFPAYRGFRPVSEGVLAGFPFRTYAGEGIQDPDRRVLKIDYDSPENPPAIQRILDELVQIDDNYYLGKAHFRLSLTSWHLLFFFALQRR
jgi:hypothetical protein